MNTSRRWRCDRGQSTVEFALVLPLLFVVVLGAAQVGLVVVAKLSVTHAAREIARAASVDPAVDPAWLAVTAVPMGEPDRVDVVWEPLGATGELMVVVRVEQRVPSVFGGLAPSIMVTASAAMLAEQDP